MTKGVELPRGGLQPASATFCQYFTTQPLQARNT
jgi:hypothetical protein